MKKPDIDIDVKDRTHALQGHDYVQASILSEGDLSKHATGVYYQKIPVDPITGFAAFPSGKEANDIAGQLDYFKIDVLPNHAYKNVEDPDHKQRLLETEPDWSLFLRKDVVVRLNQLGKSFDICDAYEPKSIEDLACIIAIIRPEKRYLIGEEWVIVKREIWKPAKNGAYSFKKSHAFAFAMAIIVQLNSMVDLGEVW